MGRYLKIISTGIAALALAACSQEAADTPATNDSADAMTSNETAAAATVVAVAQNDSRFSTFVTAVTLAQLGDTLSGDGPFTVFAPTDDAFEKVDPAALESLLAEENRDDLKALLTYHIVEGAMSAEDVVKAITDGGGSTILTTVQGGELKALMDGENVVLEDAAGGKSTITATDIEASNGVIHVIDTIVMPG